MGFLVIFIVATAFGTMPHQMAALIAESIAFGWALFFNLVKPNFKNGSALFTLPVAILSNLCLPTIPNFASTTISMTTFATESTVWHTTATTLMISARIINIPYIGSAAFFATI